MTYACGSEARIGDRVSADSLVGTVIHLAIDPDTADRLRAFDAMPSDPYSYFVTDVGVWRFDRCRLTSRATAAANSNSFGPDVKGTATATANSHSFGPDVKRRL